MCTPRSSERRHRDASTEEHAASSSRRPADGWDPVRAAERRGIVHPVAGRRARGRGLPRVRAGPVTASTGAHGVTVRTAGPRAPAPARSAPHVGLPSASRPLRWGLVGALLLSYAVVWAGVVSGSWMADADLALLRARPAALWPDLHPLVSVLVLLGQRAICLAVLAVWLGLRYLRDRDPRPLLLAAVSTLLLNVVVGSAKMAGNRLGPLQLGDGATAPGAAEVFTVGMAFPSGHSANAVLMWGVLVYLGRRHRWAGAAATAVLAAVVGLATLYLGTHWATDVWTGWALGAVVLLVLPDLAPLVDRLAGRLAPASATARPVG